MASRFLLDSPEPGSVPIRPLRKAEFARFRAETTPAARRWLEATRFEVEAGKHRLVPGSEGELGEVILGLGDEPSPWDWAGLPTELPAGSFHLASAFSKASALSKKDAEAGALGFALGTYRFERLRKSPEKELARLAWPEGCDRKRVQAAADATFLVRDLINSPASDMGPAELAAAAEAVGSKYGARIRILVGDDLLREGYPAVHAVGRAASPDRAPRLIDLEIGDPGHPKVTLVGKGVCFDSGGLDIKPATNMKLMKKDMGGGAHVLGLASMIFEAGLPVRLRVLIPAVENSISGSALRPLDVVRSRKGTTIEIGNTDAEGRVILADALTEASSESPALLIDFATLTGAARVALGADLPALFCNDDETARDLLAKADSESDPLWRMPLFKPYRKQIESKVADLTNSTDSPLAGAITAALFLQEFVGPSIPWAHVDLMAWNQSSRPGRPEGGEAMGMRAAFAFLEERFR
jgi:leucyl aminopeptidase